MKHALVTGAGSGIGRGISQRLGADGFKVSLLGRQSSTLEKTRKLLEKEGGQGQALVCDVTDPEAVKKSINQAVKSFGPLVVLVNNAGLSGRSPVIESDLDFFDQVLKTNLYGPFFVTSAALPHMIDSGPMGRIINIGSILSKIGAAGYTAYSSSKHGLVGFTRSLALEVADKGITVNCICPGWTDTTMAKKGISDTADALGMNASAFWSLARQQVPTGRMSEPEEIAGLVAYLVSPQASNLTAQTLVLDGGSCQN